MKAVLKICFRQQKRRQQAMSCPHPVTLSLGQAGETTLCFRCTTITLNMLSRGTGGMDPSGAVGDAVLCAFKSIESVSVNMQAETGLHY